MINLFSKPDDFIKNNKFRRICSPREIVTAKNHVCWEIFFSKTYFLESM